MTRNTVRVSASSRKGGKSIVVKTSVSNGKSTQTSVKRIKAR